MVLMGGTRAEGRLLGKSDVKGPGLSRGRDMVLRDYSKGGGTGMLGGAVKCVEVERNTRGEVGGLDMNLR